MVVRPASLVRRLVCLAACLIAAVTCARNGLAQSTWLPTSGTTPWTTGTAWSGGLVPNAVGAVAVFGNAGPTISLNATTVTVGTISQTSGTGNVVLGDTAVTDDSIILAVSSGVPVINVTTGNLYMYAQLSGSQGLQKNGNGVYSPRYNPLDFTYTGTNFFNGGTIQIARDGHLGDPSNPIVVSATTNLQNWASTTLGSARTISLNANTLLTAQNGAAANSLTINGNISGAGNLTLNTGYVTLGGANTYAGNTTIRSATVTLGPSSPLSTGTLTLQTSTTIAGGSLVDLGGQSQTVAALSMSLVSSGQNQVTNTFRNGSLTVSGGNLVVNSGFASAQSGTSYLNLRDLSAFAYTNTSGTFYIQTSSTVVSSTAASMVNLPVAGPGSVTAAHMLVGNSGNGPASSTSTIGMGQTTTFNTGTLTIGAYRGNGVVAFQPDVTGGSLTLRGVSGGSSRVDNVYVGYKGGGDNFGKGILDVSTGSIDARVTNFTVGRYVVYASSNQTGTFSMTSGTLDTTTLTLGAVIVATGSVGNPPISATVNQGGGLVKAGTITFGVNAGVSGLNNLPTFTSTYNLTSGTLATGIVASGTGTSGTASLRGINWAGGTITTYDASTDLAMSGVAGSGGAVVVAVAGADAKAFDVPAGRTATLGDYVTLTGSETGFTKTGGGTLVLGGANGFTSTYSGSAAVQGGTLRVAESAALASGSVTPLAGGTLALAPYLQATVGGLDPKAGGITDVGSGMITVAGGLSAADMVTALVTGLGDGSWNGASGITSSDAAASGGSRTVGWLDNGNGTMTFAFAASGDTNLDWQVDILDSANFLSSGKLDSGLPATWIEGDFTYDGFVDVLDAAAFLSTGLLDAGPYNPSPSQAGGIAAVPEPSSLAFLACASLAVAGLVARRRR
ncbi:MAG: beta strand repeat-containing protein [Planctomycetaceae bacterium]